ncbi:hypothetical protein L2X98_27765 [Microbacterium elymi]|uniref:Uncharacterized protein n=1 Tax=Microbacterium elymi TaxID=2909587 RepID=A0ABY5NH17_9MICO|nr:hypothetical protein [Microbacterium elymi]UUT34409.1 hypothetical protein L2X98_27765 [Microbacterium elymi]
MKSRPNVASAGRTMPSPSGAACGATSSPVDGSGKNVRVWSLGPALTKSPKSGPVRVTRMYSGAGVLTATTVASRAVKRLRPPSRWNSADSSATTSVMTSLLVPRRSRHP